MSKKIAASEASESTRFARGKEWRRRESNPRAVVPQRRHLRVYLVNAEGPEPCGPVPLFARPVPNEQGAVRANRLHFLAVTTAGAVLADLG